MTAAAMANLLYARRTGAGRWQAKCPAHHDRSPSLSIREGPDGRVLVHCFAGCPPDAILRALGLTWADVNGRNPLSPEQRRQAAAQRAQREASERKRRQAHSGVCARLRRLERVSAALGASLMMMADDSPSAGALSQLFHQVQDRIRTAEAIELEARP
ncbi:MAG: hypothetical protein ABR976_01795 [Terracidiphilus sp.]